LNIEQGYKKQADGQPKRRAPFGREEEPIGKDAYQ
jgi:hypothetical protein